MTARQAVRCSARTSAGKPCRAWAIAGGTVCAVHGGRAPQVKRAAARRLAASKAARTLADVGVESIENPLLEYAALAEETRALQRQVAAQVAEVDQWVGPNHLGDEALSVWVQLLERMMDRCARLLADWVRLGFDERLVTLREREADLVEAFLRAVLADPALALTDEQRAQVPAVARRHLPILDAREVPPDAG